MRRKKALVNIISSLILQIITIICGFIVPKLIISNFGSNVNGLIVSITQFLGYITLLEAGFGPVIKSLLYNPIANKDKSTIEKILKTSERIFRKIAYIFIIYVVILCFVLPQVLLSEFNSLFTIAIIIIIAISTFAEYFFGMTYRLYIQAEQENYVIATIRIISLIINTIVIVVLIKIGANIQIVKLASSLIFIARPIIQNIYVKKKYKISLKNVDSSYNIKQKWDGLAQHIAYVVHTNTDIILLTLFKKMSEISVYYIYSMIINSIKNIIKSFTEGIFDTFGDMIAKGEEEKLNKSFTIFEGYYITISTIVFASTLLLIVPFVQVYTSGIEDVNYIRPVFAILLVIAEFISVIRQPYNELIKVAGRFKETKIGAYIEVLSNIIISFALIWKFGLVGVAIGTLIAMLIRTIEFIYYTSKYILKRNVWYIYQRLFLIIIEIIIITVIVKLIPSIEITNYLTWCLQALIVFIISTIIVALINPIIYKNTFKSFINIIKKICIRK